MKRVGLLAAIVASVALLFASYARTQSTTFKATLTGKDETPAVTTPAHGDATFELSASGNSLRYTLTVADINDVTMAHIHLGEPGKEGVPVAPLYPAKMSAMSSDTPRGPMSGVIAKGSITASSLVGPLKGKTIADLVEDIRAGKTYINVHTKAHPGGEIRGTIQ